MQKDVRDKNYMFSSEDQNIFFISDPHFGHANIIRYCDRPFKDVQEMNETLIKNWNDTVNPDDIIFILGDIAFGGAATFEEIVPKLNGRKYLVLGNHDYKNVRERYKEWFVDVKPNPLCGRYPRSTTSPHKIVRRYAQQHAEVSIFLFNP